MSIHNKICDQNMQGISDPDTFELSELVEKSSKSGIFTNNRLLMIKDGFLYYYSNVPADYKTHQPNIMASLKQIPKSTIEIRSIQSISLESAKSSTLIITFYGRDMIDRDDIRKSLTSKNYNHPVKPNSQDLEQWKFIFATVMKCRLWHGCLMKLKQHFSKAQDHFDKFAEYMANFDPAIRTSLPQSAAGNRQDNSNRTSSPTKMGNQQTTKSAISAPVHSMADRHNEKYKLEKDTGIFEIQQTAEEHLQDTTPKADQKNITIKDEQRVNEELKDKMIKIEPTIKQSVKVEKVEKVEKAEEKEKSPKQDNKIHKNENDKNKTGQKNKITALKLQQAEKEKEKQIQVKMEIQKEKPEQKQKEIQKMIEKEKEKEIEKDKYKLSNKDKQKDIEKDKEREKQQMVKIIERIRKQQRDKAEDQQNKLSKELLQKQNQLQKMSEQLESNRKIQQMLEQRVLQQQQKRQQEENIKLMLLKEKRQEEEYKRLRESSDIDGLETDRKTIQIKEESIQTETEKDIIDVIEGGLELSNDRNSRFSCRSESSVNAVNINDKNSINLFRNTVSYISQVKLESTADIQSFDYYWQLGQIYKCPDLKDRISKELALAEFTRKASRRVTEIITAYIDQNKPKEPIFIDRHIFEIEIVCSRGKMIRTEGSQQLLYSNESHQNLKRTYKIYNHLNEIIIGIIKKKQNYPLRVPFCCLVEYKGYTALAKIMPILRANSINIHMIRTLGQDIPIYNLSLNDFETHGAVYSMITPSIIYKPTKEDEPSIFRGPSKYIDFIGVNRRSNISICSKKLFEQCKQIENNQQQRTHLAQLIDFCRYFKKIMKANTPFVDRLHQYQFLDDFISDPLPILQQHFSNQKNTKISGLMLYYMEKMIGIRINGKPNQDELKYSILPVTRQYGLCSLDVALFALNFDKYCLQKKYDLASKALNYRKYLSQDYSQILLNEAHLHIHQQQYQQALQKLELSLQMVSQHDPKRMKALQLQAQCLQASGQQIQAMTSLKALLQQTEYIYGDDSLIEVYFLIADSLSRQRLIPQLTQVYRKILSDSPKDRQRVLVNFSQNLLVHQDIDPHVLLDFLSKELSSQIENGQPLVQQLLGELYLRVKNKNKAQGYFTSAFNQFLAEGSSFDHICQTFIKCYQCCGSLQQRKSLHRQLYIKLSQTDFISSSSYCKIINTLAVETICQGYNYRERDFIINFLQEEKKKVDRPQFLEWVWLDSVLRGIVEQDKMSSQEKSMLLFNINGTQISQFCMILNNRINAS